MSPNVEQRRAPRAKVKLRARYSSGASEFESTITSISEAGLFLYATHLDPEGTSVRIEFALGSRPTALQATGEVVYIGFQDGLRGMGIRFNRMAENDRAAILRFVQDSKPN
ncbi:MAG: PilZ domain-containing protein [Acidobacteriota bacterium]